MDVIQTIKTVAPVDRQQGTVLYECRTCGTTVDSELADCPYCGPTDVVRYDIY